MKIIISGCGKIGGTILASLVSEGHDIVAIDSDSAVLTEITNIHDVMGVCGNGADSDILTEAGVAGAEMFGRDEYAELFPCQTARGKEHYRKDPLARVQRPQPCLRTAGAGAFDGNKSGASGGARAFQYFEIPLCGQDREVFRARL